MTDQYDDEYIPSVTQPEHSRKEEHTDDKLRKLMLSSPVSSLVDMRPMLKVAPVESIQDVIEKLQAGGTNCAVVCEEGSLRLLGIVSNRDILRKVAGHLTDLSEIPVKAVMTRNPEVVRPDDPIAFVVNKMGMGGFRHVPIVDDAGSPTGVVSIHDVMHYLATREE